MIKYNGLGQRLLDAMDEREITAYKIAQDTGISASTIANYIGEMTTPSKSKLDVLCTYIGINKDWLLFGDGEMLLKEDTTPANGEHAVSEPIATYSPANKEVEELKKQIEQLNNELLQLHKDKANELKELNNRIWQLQQKIDEQQEQIITLTAKKGVPHH